jgi:uncharacterized repeat protein (TIGR01451 family)
LSQQFGPSRRVLVPLTAAAALLVAMALSFGWLTSTSAASACGSKLCLDISHSPDNAHPPDNASFVSPGSYVTYTVAVSNPGPSTATKVTLTDALDPDTTLVSDLPTGCTLASTTITCSLGSVKPTGIGPPRLLRFTVSMPTAEGDTSNRATLSYDARASDTGNDPKGDPTDESFFDDESVEVRAVEDLADSVVPDGLPLQLNTDYDGSGTTANDPQTVRLDLLAKGFSTTATVDDDVPDAGFVCPARLKCPTGGWVEASVPGPPGKPDPFKSPSSFKIELSYDSTVIPSGLTRQNYVLLHDKDDPNTRIYEQIKRSCKSNPPPCLDDVQVLADGDFLIKATVNGNWRFR